jgi:hypothetical protein
MHSINNKGINIFDKRHIKVLINVIIVNLTIHNNSAKYTEWWIFALMIIGFSIRLLLKRSDLKELYFWHNVA